MTFEERKAQVKTYLGKKVVIGIDRPMGYTHHKENYSLTYPINYGYIPGVLGGDGEELDVYLLGVNEPVTEYECEIIAIAHRHNDVEDKLVGAPVGMRFSKEEIANAIHLQEQYYNSEIEVAEKHKINIGNNGELWDIYDINRNKTGRTVERGKPMSQDEYHIVVNVWIKNTDGKWLISKRSPNKHYGNLWECCGGSAVSGEDSLTAALREAKEELGVKLKAENGKLFTSAIRQYRTFPDFLDVWVFNQDFVISDVVLQEGETCDAKWATREEILEMEKNGEFIPLNVFPYLEKLFESEK